MDMMQDGDRYARMPYRRTGRSGLLLPAITLGLWQNFGGDRPIETQRAIIRRAFDLGITHFDLANNYGPPYGSAEENFGRSHPAPAVDATAHPPAVLLDAQPLDREGSPRRAGPARDRLHHILAPGAGAADRSLPAGYPGWFAGQPRRIIFPGDADRADARKGAGAQPGGPAARPDAGPDGAGLDAARPSGDIDTGRRQQRRAAGTERQCDRQAGFFAGRAR